MAENTTTTGSGATTSGTASKTTTSSSTPPPSGEASSGPESVASAESETSLKSLASDAGIDEATFDKLQSPVADKTEIAVIDGQEAAKTSAAETGAGGLALSATGEIAGGNIKKVLEPPPDDTRLNVPMVKERAALLSPIYQKLAGAVNRPISEWGLLGPGDVVKGQMMLLDMKTGEKIRASDGHKINEGQLYANLRIFPEAMSQGDTIEKMLAG